MLCPGKQHPPPPSQAQTHHRTKASANPFFATPLHPMGCVGPIISHAGTPGQPNTADKPLSSTETAISAAVEARTDRAGGPRSHPHCLRVRAPTDPHTDSPAHPEHGVRTVGCERFDTTTIDTALSFHPPTPSCGFTCALCPLCGKSGTHERSEHRGKSASTMR